MKASEAKKATDDTRKRLAPRFVEKFVDNLEHQVSSASRKGNYCTTVSFDERFGAECAAEVRALGYTIITLYNDKVEIKW